MKKIILDLDTGIDDTLALSYILGSEDAELIGITGTYGNVLLETGIRMIWICWKCTDDQISRCLRVCRIPVMRILSRCLTVQAFFTVAMAPAMLRCLQRQHVRRLISSQRFHYRIARKYSKEELVYVPTGPSTNIDAAFVKAPDIVDKLTIVMMGGALTQPGNCNPYMEANISMDPKASNRMFSTSADITMIGLDVTMQALMTKKDTQALRDVGTKAGAFLADMTDYYIDISEETDPAFQGGCNLHDPLAAAVALDPTLVTTFPIDLMVETEGPSIGRTIGDPTRLLSQPKNTKVALGVDAERFTSQFMERLLKLAATVD